MTQACLRREGGHARPLVQASRGARWSAPLTQDDFPILASLLNDPSSPRRDNVAASPRCWTTARDYRPSFVPVAPRRTSLSPRAARAAVAPQASVASRRAVTRGRDALLEITRTA